MRSRRAISSSALAAGDAEQVGVETHVSSTRQVAVESEALGHVADAVLDGLRLPRHVQPRHHRPAFGRVEQPGEHAQSGGLAGAVGADQPEHFAARDLEIQAVDGRQLCEAAGEILGAHHHYLPSSRIWASTGMLDFNSRCRLSASILIR
jgi:hypothetical protein